MILKRHERSVLNVPIASCNGNSHRRAIVDNIVTHNDEPDEIGVKLQRIYDQIYDQNWHDP